VIAVFSNSGTRPEKLIPVFEHQTKIDKLFQLYIKNILQIFAEIASYNYPRLTEGA
jgi:EAL domain-containing protein (putative c-di-GMP-specific phosphodiesterase class I)